MSNPPRTGVSSPETAKKAPPRGSGTDASARMFAYISAQRQKDGSAIYAETDVWPSLSPAEKNRRIAAYFERVKGNKYKYLYRSDAYIKMMKNRKIASPDAGCRTTFSVYMPTTQKVPISRNAQGTWLCQKSIDSAITFRERKYQNQENDLRVFIEGAEVTPYVEGSISWTTESTGGINTCRFILNNTQDAFIITPTNVCAGPYNVGAWRMNWVRKGKTHQPYVYKGINRSNWRVDEVAKWQIYKRKYEAVNPDKDKKQIDSFTGMWLYPLNPFSCIFNKHDAVRVFVRLPHVPPQHKRGTDSWYDLWMPAFTGFIDKYSWSDAPVEGKRTVNITCYDYRGLMERMRVRVYSLGVTDSGRTDRGPTAPQTSGQRGPAKNNSDKNTPSHENKSYLKRAIAKGKSVEKDLKQVFLNAKSTKLYSNTANPYEYGAQLFYMEKTYIDLHTLWILKESTSANGGRGCGPGKSAMDLRLGFLAKPGVNYDINCMFPIIANIDSTVSKIAVDITTSIGYLLQKIMLVFDLIGDAYVAFPDAVKPAEGVGNSPGKALRVTKLTLVDVQNLDKNAVNSKIAKKNSLEALAKSASDYINTGIVTPTTHVEKGVVKVIPALSYAVSSYKALFKQDAIIYAAAVSIEDASYEARRMYGNSRNVQKDAWSIWLSRARTDKVITLTDKEYDTLSTESISDTVAKYGDRLRAQDNYVYSLLLSSRNRLVDPETYNKTPTNVRTRKQIETIRKQIAKLSEKEKKSKKDAEKKAIAKQIKLLEGQLKALRNTSTRSETSLIVPWVEQELRWKRVYIANDTIFYAGKISQNLGEVDDSATAAALAARCDAAANSMREFIDVKIRDWRISYDELSTNSRRFAGRVLEQANRILSTKGRPVPQGATYENYVKVVSEQIRYSYGATGAYSIVHIGDALRWINWKREQLKKQVKGGTSASILRKTQGLIESIRLQTAAGKAAQAQTKGAADALLKFAHFETRNAGIFADLVTAVGLQPHPLMGKSLRQSIEYLCCEQQHVVPGVTMSVSNYKDGGGPYKGKNKPQSKGKNKRSKLDKPSGYGKTVLDAWNRTVMFGVVGRPLTYPEVTLVGQGTLSDFRSAFSPFNIFFHMLKPADGTGASTIIQLNTGTTTINSLNVSYETRKKLLDDICSVLDYQYWVSGWGDLIFEMPHYNAMPADFGKIVEQSYTLKRDWTNATISEEAQDIPTAWVINGQHIDKANSPTDGTKLTSNFFKTVVLLAPVLARRIGIRVENINIKIPGLGGAGDVQKSQSGKVSNTVLEQARDQLRVYGYFHIQRQLGRAHSLQVDMPFRPYVVPNRPIWFVPRQRIGLVKSVTHTMNPPTGTCTTNMNLVYTRWLFRDGTFRFVAGGPRQPVSYMSFFTGVPPRKYPKEGTLDEDKQVAQRGNTSNACSSKLTIADKQANAFSSAVASQWGVAYSAPVRISRPSAPSTATVDLQTSGIRQSVEVSPTGPHNVTTTLASRKTGDPLFHMQHIWKDIPGKKDRGFQGFGYLRFWSNQGGSLQNRYKDANFVHRSSSSRDDVHVGWDMPTSVGTPCKTPIDVLSASLILEIGAWRFYGTKTVFAKVGTTGDTSLKILKEFRVGNQVKTVKGYIKIYAVPYAIFQDLGGAKVNMKLRRGTACGLRLEITGYASLPGLNNGGILEIKLDYLHLSGVRKFPTSKGEVPLGTGELKRAKKGGPPLVGANQVICYAGNTGCGGAHLHLNLKVRNKSIGGTHGEDQLKAAIAANKAFIDTQLRARAAFYDYKGVDPRDDLDKITKAHDFWQKYKRRITGKRHYTKPITVDDVVNYYKKRSTYRRFVPKYTNTGGWILFNAAIFFTYEQIIDKTTNQYSKYNGLFSRAIAQSENYSKSYQRQYKMLCQTTAKRTLEYLANERSYCEYKYPIYKSSGVIPLPQALVGKPLKRAKELQRACIMKIDKQRAAVERAQGVLVLASVNSPNFRRSDTKIMKFTPKAAKALRAREESILNKQAEKRVANSLGGSVNGPLVPIR